MDANKIAKRLEAMEKRLPKLIKRGAWDEIDLITQIPKSEWEGKSADGYERYRAKMVSERNAEKIKLLPLNATSLIMYENMDAYTEEQKAELAVLMMMVIKELNDG